MNKLVFGSIFCSAIVANGAQGEYVDPVKEQRLIEVCEAIKSDNLTRLYRAVEDSKISITQLANRLICNGVDPVTFALEYSAKKTASFMASKSQTNHEELLSDQ